MLNINTSFALQLITVSTFCFRKLAKLPYHSADKYFIVNSSGNSLTLQTNNGIRLVWDSDGYLELIVPPIYRDKMCGLCGKLIMSLNR